MFLKPESGLFSPLVVTGPRALFKLLLHNACGNLGTKTDGPVLRTRITACFTGLNKASFAFNRHGTPQLHLTKRLRLSWYENR